MRHPAALLKELGIAPLKSLGQNFLTDDHSLQGAEKLFDKNATLLEIGPGLGMTTDYFTRAGFRMLLIEKDRSLAAEMQRRYPQHKVISGDFLEQSEELLLNEDVRAVVSNLPFYITTPILERICARLPAIERGLFGMQKEVAQRIMAERGNSLAMFLRATGDARIFSKVSRNSFYPAPEVDVCWLYWQRNTKINDLESFELLLRGVFWGKRKSIAVSLKKNPFFDSSPHGQRMRDNAAGLTAASAEFRFLSQRPDALTFAEFQELHAVLSR